MEAEFTPPIWLWGRSRSPRRVEREDQDDPGRRKPGDRRGHDHGDKGETLREEKAEFEGKTLTLKEYILRRRFFFLHLYSGPHDPLGQEIERAAKKRRMKVTVESFDKEKDGANLLAEEPFGGLLKEAKEGKWDGYHAGFPCTSFSRLRWNPREGYPGPCRSRDSPYGLSTNTAALQAECDEGTIHASRSLLMGDAIMSARPGDRIKPSVTFENPPPSDHPHHCSAWELPEVAAAVEKLGLTKVTFTSCFFQKSVELGRRTFKPQMFAGSLLGIRSMVGECPCGKAPHIPVIGKKRSVESGHYSRGLCRAPAGSLQQTSFGGVLRQEGRRLEERGGGIERQETKQG